MTDRYVRVSRETSFGDTGTVHHFLNAVSETFALERDDYVDDETLAAFPSVFAPGNMRVTGSLTTHLQAVGAVPRILAALFGSFPAPTGTGPYTYTITPKDIPASLTIRSALVPDISKAKEMLGMVPTAATLTLDATEARPQLEVEFVGRELGLVAPDATVVFPSDRFFHTRDVTVTLGGAPFRPRSLELVIERAIDEDHYVLDGTGKLAGILPTGKFSVHGSIEIPLQMAESEYLDFLNAAAKGELVVRLSYDTGAAERTLQFRIPRWYYQNPSVEVSGREAIILAADFVAIHDGTNPYVELKIINNEGTLD